MKFATLRAYCLSFPGATEEIQWESHLLFKVGGKMFVITSPDEPECPLSLKSTHGEFEEWIEREGVVPAPYMARNKWLRLKSSDAVSAAELKQLIARSYELVVAGLPKKVQAQLAKPQASASSAAKARARSKASLP
jgi:predicted DNA-binding protein (MmcQ/YjbR family)